MRRHLLPLAPMLALCLALPAHADDDLLIEAQPLLGDGLSFRIAGYAWAPRFDGNVRAGGAAIALRDDFDHGGTRWAPWGEFQVRNDVWAFRFSGYTVSEDVSAIATGPLTFGSASAVSGDVVASDLSIDSANLEVGYTIWRPFAARPAPWVEDRTMTGAHLHRAQNADLRFGVVGGLRWIGLDHDVTVSTPGGALLGRDSRSADWFTVYGGIEIELAIRTREMFRVIDHLVVNIVAAGGAEVTGDGPMFDVRAGLDVMFTPNFGLSVGYRLQDFDLDDRDYTFDGGLQGMVVGGVIRF